MKNKKGFTLIELLATIILLGMVITIAVLSTSNIKSKINEKSYSNIKEIIKTKAKEYVKKTGNNRVDVKTLISEGYLTSDDETGNIYNPIDNSSMNCDYVIILEDFLEYQVSEKCYDEYINDLDSPQCVVISENEKWTSTNVTIEYGCKDEGENASGCATKSIKKEITSTIKTYTIPDYIIYDNAGNAIVCKGVTANVFLDSAAPIINKASITSQKDGYNSENVFYNIEVNDLSGIKEICISDKVECNSWISIDDSSVKYTNDMIQVSSVIGTDGDGQKYQRYIYVKDNAGNISSVKEASYTLYEKCTSTGKEISGTRKIIEQNASGFTYTYCAYDSWLEKEKCCDLPGVYAPCPDGWVIGGIYGEMCCNGNYCQQINGWGDWY